MDQILTESGSTFDERITAFERAVAMVASEWTDDEAFSAYMEAKRALQDAIAGEGEDVMHRTTDQIMADTTLTPAQRAVELLHIVEDFSKGLGGTAYIALRRARETVREMVREGK